MKLSIITINFNNNVNLDRTIQSVLQQDCTDYEYIVIDGASTDGSVETIEKYEKNIDYWISEPDKGIYNAMNKGIRQAKGEYLYFLNSGDLLASPTVLSQMLEGELTESFICANFITEAQGILANDISNSERDWSLAIYELFARFLCHQSFFIRADNFVKYGLYNETLKVVADWELFFRAIAIDHASVLCKDFFLVIYNAEGFSSQTGNEIIYKEKLIVCNTYLKPSLTQKLERLYFLDQNQYITDIVRSRSWIFNGFRAFCKLGRILGFIKG